MDGGSQGRAAADPLLSHRLHAPAEIAAIAYQNKASIYALLFKAASDTMLTIAADPKHLGAKVGITAVLHTWGSALTQNPHSRYRALSSP
jgi:(p)ppGpp synthase/HD superfamily hydrolase